MCVESINTRNFYNIMLKLKYYEYIEEVLFSFFKINLYLLLITS